MSRGPGPWWRDLPGPARFRIYSRVILQVSVVGVALLLVVGAPGRWAVAGLVASTLVAVAVVEVQPGLASGGRERLRRFVVPAGAVVLTAVWVGYALVANLAEEDRTVRAARVAGIFTVLVLVLAVLPFVRGRWWWLLAASAATSLALEQTGTARSALFGLLLGCGGFGLLSMMLTVSGLRIVDDLEQARTLEARLRVADERLRFSRDLHDVVGRGFSAVAVKSELAATLARSGAVDRAAAEMDEVRGLAVESMEQLRGLVRGYRDIDLDSEVAGARSLLAAAGCRLVVEGGPDRLPTRFHEVAAWATREGTTNIVRHSTATSAVLAFGPAGMSLRNDGVHGPPDEWSGLRGLAERAAQVGAELRTGRTGGEFELEIRWGTP